MCGESLPGTVIGSDGVRFGPDSAPVPIFSIGDVCPGCDTEFDVDTPSTFEGCRTMRHFFLQRKNWDALLLTQMDENLGLNQVALAQEGAEVWELAVCVQKSRAFDRPDEVMWRLNAAKCLESLLLHQVHFTMKEFAYRTQAELERLWAGVNKDAELEKASRESLARAAALIASLK